MRFIYFSFSILNYAELIMFLLFFDYIDDKDNLRVYKISISHTEIRELTFFVIL